MGNKPNNHPYQKLMEGPVYESHIDPITGAMSFVPRGYLQSINGKPYGALAPDWVTKLQEHAPAQITDEMRNRIEATLINYQMDRAGELAAISWKALYEGLASITKAATALQLALDKPVAATGYLQQRLEQLEVDVDQGFKRDDFYPMLTQLTFRARLLREALQSEEKRGDRLRYGSAWACFVFNMATIYWQMTGKKPTSTEISNDIAKPSQFAKFAFAAMSINPVGLRREPPKGRSETIRSFSTALREPIKEWEELRVFPKRRARNSR
ncbi:hypothetical protein AMST5_02813 [freshwater sediment metagenome]|uniref:Uncharacterized protein n=1 Tax=freshwater sediment metagenome TaxID=556182 RepID=A0AA48M2M0_9ZZZZ